MLDHMLWPVEDRRQKSDSRYPKCPLQTPPWVQVSTSTGPVTVLISLFFRACTHTTHMSRKIRVSQGSGEVICKPLGLPGKNGGEFYLNFIYDTHIWYHMRTKSYMNSYEHPNHIWFVNDIIYDISKIICDFKSYVNNHIWYPYTVIHIRTSYGKSYTVNHIR